MKRLTCRRSREQFESVRFLHRAACALLVAGTTCTLGCVSESAGGPNDGAAAGGPATAGHAAGHLPRAGTFAGAGAAGVAGSAVSHVAASAGSAAPMQLAAAETSTGPAFSISLSTSGCLEGCKEYDVKVDQSGNIEFNGRGNTRQQGWAGKTTPAQTASDLLAALRAANYWQLSDQYRTQNDGCTGVMDERATYIWNVKEDGAAKIVVDYQGCTGVPQLEALRRMPAMLTTSLQLEAWIGS